VGGVGGGGGGGGWVGGGGGGGWGWWVGGGGGGVGGVGVGGCLGTRFDRQAPRHKKTAALRGDGKKGSRRLGNSRLQRNACESNPP